jgi:hypothetical protein
MFKTVCGRYLIASAFVLGSLFSASGAFAQIGSGAALPPGEPDRMFQDLIGDWNNTAAGETGGLSISVRRNGDVLQQGAPMARVADTITAGGNFAFEGGFPPPDNRLFRCTYFISFLAGNTRASFRLVDQRGEAITCAQGVFERVAPN